MYRVKTRGFNANLPVFLVVLFGAVLLITAKSKNAPITRDLRFMNRTQVVKYPASGFPDVYRYFDRSTGRIYTLFFRWPQHPDILYPSEIYYGSPIDGIHWFVVA